MINEEKFNKLQLEVKDLTERLDGFTKEENATPTESNFQDINFFPNIKTGNLIIKYLETTASLEPAILVNQIILWKDTTNTKYYLKANFNGTPKKVELT